MILLYKNILDFFKTPPPLRFISKHYSENKKVKIKTSFTKIWKNEEKKIKHATQTRNNKNVFQKKMLKSNKSLDLKGNKV